MACDVAPLAMFCFLRHHCHQWFFNGFGIRQSLVTMVFDGCAPWDQYSFDTTERKEASIYLACKGNSQEKSCFWKPPKYGSTGFLSPSTQCVGSNTWHQVCQGSSTEWRFHPQLKISNLICIQWTHTCGWQRPKLFAFMDKILLH